MNDPEFSIGDDHCPYSWLNEWLCEYVDGTMDPSVRRVFEKYVQANPELREHIDQLRHTRELLCRCRAPQTASDRVRARVQEKVESDLLRSPHSLEEAVRERPVAAFTSTLVVALVVGMFAGAVFFAPESVSRVPRTANAERTPPAGSLLPRPALQVDPFVAPPVPLHELGRMEASMSYYSPAYDSMNSKAAWMSMVSRP